MTFFKWAGKSVGTRRSASVLLLVAAILASSAVYAQPPQRGGRDSGRSERTNRNERGSRNERGGRDAERGPGAPGQPGAPGGGWGQPGAPGGGWGQPGAPGGGWGQPGANGAPGGDQKPDDGQNGQNNQTQKKPERVVNLEDALAKTDGTTPITLNQNEFRASDGVKMTGTYFKGKGDKDTPLVVILPDLNHSREDEALVQLGFNLAKVGYAALIPDLRGRGANANRQPNAPNGGPQAPQRPANARPSNMEIRQMITVDKDLWFNFILYLHNAGYINAKKTILVGAEFSAALAVAWAKDDWSTKGAAGQNVVGLVLLSPDAVDTKDRKKKKDEDEDEVQVEKYDVLASLESVKKMARGKGNFGCLLVTGRLDEEKFEDAQLIQRKIGGKAEEELKPDEKSVPLAAIETKKQGDALLELADFGVVGAIQTYVGKRMKEIPAKRNKWQEIDLSKLR